MTLPVRPPSSAACRSRSRSRVAVVEGASLHRSVAYRAKSTRDEGDVLELAQVAEVVRGGQTSLPHPAERFTQPPLCDPHPCPHGRDGSHIGEEVTDVQALRLIEQVECAVQISFSLSYPGHRDLPAVPVLRQACVLAQLLASQQVPRGGRQVVALAVDLAHPHIHVRRSPQHRPALLGRGLQRLLVGAHRFTETTLRYAGYPPARSRTRGRRRRTRPAAVQSCIRHTPGAHSPDPRSPRTPAPTSPLPMPARGGPPEGTARAPTGRASLCPARHLEPGPARPGTTR